MSATLCDASLVFTTWSQVWSPLVDESVREQAWNALGLARAYADCRNEYWNLFHVGMPMPKISLLLHAALSREGSAVREDFLRVMHHLDLRWNETSLSPDQLGVACEVYAFAIDQAEPRIVAELRERYLLPWCDVAERRLTDGKSELAFLPQAFREDLQSVEIHGSKF